MGRYARQSKTQTSLHCCRDLPENLARSKSRYDAFQLVNNKGADQSGGCSSQTSEDRFSRVEAHITFYQSPLILTELFQHDLINVSYLTACYLYQVMMTLHFFNDVAIDAEPTQKLKITPYRIPGSRLLISSLPGSSLRTHVESLGKPRDVNMHSQSLAW